MALSGRNEPSLDTSRRVTYLPDRSAGLSTWLVRLVAVASWGPFPPPLVISLRGPMIRLLGLFCQVSAPVGRVSGHRELLWWSWLEIEKMYGARDRGVQ